MKLKIETKKRLHSLCMDYVEKRIANAKLAMQSVQDSANEESKSSVGDKYETGRAMMQLETEKYAVQLDESLKLKQVLSQIKPDLQHDFVALGSAVTTNHGNFFIAVSAGKIDLGENIYYAVSPVSPIGSKLLGAKTNDKITFNDKFYQIQEVV